MSLLFWGISTAMLATAIGFVIFPLIVQRKTTRWPQLAMAVLVPTAALGLYAELGSPGAAVAGGVRSDTTQYARIAESQSRPANSTASVGSLVDGLRERLQREPNDGSGWLLLARSYEHLGRYPEAALARERARSLGEVDGELDNSPRDTTIAARQEPASTGPALRGRIELSAGAKSLVEPGDTVFIFAKESVQQRMPVAAVRKPVTDLPIHFELTDKQVMVPGTRLADYPSLVVSARISRTGLATDTIAGLEARSEPLSPAFTGEIELMIATESIARVDGNE